MLFVSEIKFVLNFAFTQLPTFVYYCVAIALVPILLVGLNSRSPNSGVNLGRLPIVNIYSDSK